jgi:tetratricopeptide (TPR) repeat protein
MSPFPVALLAFVLGATAPADTLRESPPAPLLRPGRVQPRPAAGAVDSLRQSREARAREYYRRGLDLERGGAGGAAIVSYRLALRNDSTLAGANFRIGKLFLTVDQYGEAAAAFAAEVERHPGDTAAARELGLALSRLDEHERAIAQLELLARRGPQEPENWRALGYAYLGAGRAKDAETALRRAVALPGAGAAAHRDLGFVLAAGGRATEARAEYRRALEIDPREAGAWLNLANLDRARGETERALGEFRSAERADSTLTAALKGQALALVELARPEEAGGTYRRLLARAPGDVETRFAAVRLYVTLGRADIALELARDGVRHDRRSADARLILGMALEAGGSRREAAGELRRAEAFAPDSAGRARARGLLGTLNRQASDSLRAVFAADSVEFARERAQRPAPPRRTVAPRPALPDGTPRPVMAVPPETVDSLFLPVVPGSR